MKFNEIGNREFKECLKYNPSEVKAAIDILEKQIGNNVNR